MSYPEPSGPHQPPQYGVSAPPNLPPVKPAWEQTAPPPKRGSNGLVVGLVAAIVALICVIYGLGGYITTLKEDGSATQAEDSPRATRTEGGSKGTAHTVRYEVSGSGTVLVTWAGDAGNTGNEDATAPWQKEVTISDGSFGIKLSAYGKDAGGGTPTDQGLSCKIFIDGDEKVSRTGTNKVECTTKLAS